MLRCVWRCVVASHTATQTTHHHHHQLKLMTLCTNRRPATPTRPPRADHRPRHVTQQPTKATCVSACDCADTFCVLVIAFAPSIPEATRADASTAYTRSIVGQLKLPPMPPLMTFGSVVVVVVIVRRLVWWRLFSAEPTRIGRTEQPARQSAPTKDIERSVPLTLLCRRQRHRQRRRRRRRRRYCSAAKMPLGHICRPAVRFCGIFPRTGDQKRVEHAIRECVTHATEWR